MEINNIDDFYRLPETTESIIFGDRFNKPIDQVEWPQSLQSITFGYEFNQPIDQVKWPQSLQSITFGYKFNQPIDQVKWSQSLQSITIGGAFNRPIDQVKWSQSLQSITLGYEFNQPIDQVKWPQSLQSITFLGDFNRSIDQVKWPQSLQSITFGYYFNQPIDQVTWSQSLKSITFGDGFNRPIDQVKWPQSLQSITFGFNFNQPIDKVEWPQSLQSITFRFYFNRPIDKVKWRQSLQSITVGSLFNQPINNTLLVNVYRKHYDDDEDKFITEKIHSGAKIKKKFTYLLEKRKQPKNLKLPKPSDWTKWQELCFEPKSKLNNDDLISLKKYAQFAMIDNYEQLKPAQLCAQLAKHLEEYQSMINKQTPMECHNDDTLEGDSFKIIPNNFIIKDDQGYCFTGNELTKLKVHPYTNQPLEEVTVKGQPILSYLNSHPELMNSELMNLHQMYKSNERSMTVEYLLTNDLVDTINASKSPGTKYLHPNDVSKYEMKPEQRKNLLQELRSEYLTKTYPTINFFEPFDTNNFRCLTYVEWLTVLLNYIKRIPSENKATAKFLILELLKENP